MLLQVLGMIASDNNEVKRNQQIESSTYEVGSARGKNTLICAQYSQICYNSFVANISSVI